MTPDRTRPGTLRRTGRLPPVVGGRTTPERAYGAQSGIQSALDVRGRTDGRTLPSRTPQPEMTQPPRVGARGGWKGLTPPPNLLGSRHGVGALNRARSKQCH